MIAASWLPENHNRFPKYHLWDLDYEDTLEHSVAGQPALCGRRIKSYEFISIVRPEEVAEAATCVRCAARRPQ